MKRTLSIAATAVAIILLAAGCAATKQSPSLTASKSSVAFSQSGPGIEVSPQTVNLTTVGGNYAWTATADKAFITLSKKSGVGSDSIDIGIDSTGLNVGTYTGTVTFASDTAASFTIAVSLVIGVPHASSVFVTTTDYSTGGFGKIDIPTMTASSVSDANVSADNDVRYYAGVLYFLNRTGANGDNIALYNAVQPTATPIFQFSTGVKSNPHDIAFVSPTKAYVACYGMASILVVNPSTGETLRTIDLSTFADDDGIPEMDRMVVVDNILYVSLERLDENNYFSPTIFSSVIAIDTATDAPKTLIKLTGLDPITDLDYLPVSKKIVLGEVGLYGVNDGMIETIDTTTGLVSGTILSESQLGGDINAIAMKDETTGYAIISDASYKTELVRFDLSAKTAAMVVTSSGFNFGGIAIDDAGRLWLADRDSSNPRVRVFDTTNNDTELTSTLTFTLPPSKIVVY